MLKLVSTNAAEPVSFPLLAEMKYFAGRKNGTFSISMLEDPLMRLYAQLKVEHAVGNVNEPLLTPTIEVRQPGSNSKIFVKEHNFRLNFGQTIILEIGDKLCFGNVNNEFRIDYTPLVVVVSSKTSSPDLKTQIATLGGHCLDTWSCAATHLVVNEIELTVKTFCALLAGKWIVSPGYISELLLAYISERPLPNPRFYVPPVAIKNRDLKIEKTAFYPDTSRTTLFAGKTFLFATKKHLKDLILPVMTGGGTAKLVVDASGENILMGDFVIMGGPMDIEKIMENPTARRVIEFYKNVKKRVVADEEIGMAVLCCSVEKYCNADAKMDG